jgi:hypothetical protein
LRIVLRAWTRIQARIDAPGHPALATEESVWKTERRRFEVRGAA